MTPSCKRTCHLRRIRELDIRMSLYRDFRLSAVQAIHKYTEESSNSEKIDLDQFTNEDRTPGYCWCDCL